MSVKLRMLSTAGAVAIAVSGGFFLQATVEDRVSDLETRVATLESRAGIIGATPADAPSPTETPMASAARPGDMVFSGPAGQSISEPFELTDGNWFARVEQEQSGGRFTATAVQFQGGDNNASIFYLYDNPPAISDETFTIYDTFNEVGSYVLEVDAEYPWTLTLSSRPF